MTVQSWWSENPVTPPAPQAPRRRTRPSILPPRPPPGVDTSRHHDGVYWCCHSCRRWGREGWTHICDAGTGPAKQNLGNNWFVSVQAIRVAESAHRPRVRRPFLTDARTT